MVKPWAASSILSSSTSLIISGSSADVVWSNSMTFGVRRSARAIAARRCWAPLVSSRPGATNFAKATGALRSP